MKAHTTTNQPESCLAPGPSNPKPACPLCGGVLVDVRSGCRCLRCTFTICQGCEGGSAEPLNHEE